MCTMQYYVPTKHRKHWIHRSVVEDPFTVVVKINITEFLDGYLTQIISEASKGIKILSLLWIIKMKKIKTVKS